MTHYADEELILYYYGEGRRRAAIERHLATCASCAANFSSLSGTLALITAPETPTRDEQYGLEVWQRIRHQLPEQHSSFDPIGRIKTALGLSTGDQPGRAPLFGAPWSRVAVVAGAAMVVIAAFVAGRFWPRPPAIVPPPTDVTAAMAGARQRILLAAVSDHLDRTERVLTEIMHAPDRSDITAEQRWADDLLDASRLYRQDAVEVGEQSIAAVLDDLERSLLEIVHSPSPISAADLEQIRRRIDATALLFKVRVLSDDLRQRESAPARAPVSRTSTRKVS